MKKLAAICIIAFICEFLICAHSFLAQKTHQASSRCNQILRQKNTVLFRNLKSAISINSLLMTHIQNQWKLPIFLLSFYRRSPFISVFGFLGHCTDLGTVLNGDWSSTKPHKTGNFTFQRPLLFCFFTNKWFQWNKV